MTSVKITLYMYGNTSGIMFTYLSFPQLRIIRSNEKAKHKLAIAITVINRTNVTNTSDCQWYRQAERHIHLDQGFASISILFNRTFLTIIGSQISLSIVDVSTYCEIFYCHWHVGNVHQSCLCRFQCVHGYVDG